MATVLAALVTVLVAVPSAAWSAPASVGEGALHSERPGPGAAHPLVDTGSPLDITVTSVVPAVAVPGETVTVRATVTNTSRQPLSGVEVRVLLGTTVLGTRDRLDEYAHGHGAAVPSREIDTVRVPSVMAAGESAAVTLTLPPEAIGVPGAFGVRPLLVEAMHEEQAAIKRSFLPVHARKEYEPLRMAFVLPLTMDPDARLVTGTGEARDEAWAGMSGAGGRIDDILNGAAGHKVTYALDPALVGYTETHDPDNKQEPRTTSKPGPLPESETVRDAVARTAVRVADPEASVWELPPNDPDIAALTAPGADERLLLTIAATDPDLPSLLANAGAAMPTAVSQPSRGATDRRLAWPVGSALDDNQRIEADRAFTAEHAGADTVFVQASDLLDPPGATTPTAARRTPGGSPMVVTDSALGNIVEGATHPRRTGEAVQRFLAESLTLLAQSPGVSRDVVVATPRDFAPAPGALDELLTAAERTPWLRIIHADEVVKRAGTDTSPVARPLAVPESTPAEPAEARSPVTPTVVERLVWANQHINGIGRVLTATPDSNLVPSESTTAALASTRWRGHPDAHRQALTNTLERIDTLTTGVTVLPSTVNFLADHGVLQVTVVNNLDVAVHNVRLVLDTDERTPRLRIQQPAPMSIAPGSRTTVRVAVEAVAAGVVPVSTYLETPTGTRLGSDATVNVRVQPTGGWTIAVGGAVVALVFVIGVARTVKRGRTRVSGTDLDGLDLQ